MTIPKSTDKPRNGKLLRKTRESVISLIRIEIMSILVILCYASIDLFNYRCNISSVVLLSLCAIPSLPICFPV